MEKQKEDTGFQVKKLYDFFPYEKEFDAVITDIHPVDEDVSLITLDRTLFFPMEGGQSSDTGTISGCEVTHVEIDGSLIIHTVKCKDGVFKKGSRVHGMIDWERRFSNMQNHTGEHILSGILHEKWQSENTGFHLSDNIVTVDTSKELTKDEIRELEYAANLAVYSNIPITCRYYEPSELEGITYRSKKQFDEPVRIVSIPGIDICACCAPHVKNTGEVGIIKIIDAIRHRGGMRFTILCGKRAFIYLSRLQDISDELTGMLSAKGEALIPAVNRLIDENRELVIKMKNAEADNLRDRIRELDPDVSNAILFTGMIDNVVQRNAVNDLSSRHAGICAVFSSDGDGGYNYICSWREGDARKIASFLKEKHAARGGGSELMVQGNIKASEEEIKGSLKELAKE
ncbi:MAG: hypothetical protein K6G22_06955 [Lachnospiraceae bacterium]|nr:hypothetical protein [Lachnospiraceae bacterium]